MAKQAELEKLTGLASRFGAFITEQHPFALADALDAFEAATGGRDVRDEAGIEALRPALHRELTRRLQTRAVPEGLPDTTPRTSASARMELAYGELLDACDGFLRRAAIEASLTREERLEILRGMVLTRATDNRLKALFLGGDVRCGAATIQGKGFRSLGQEAIYGAAMRLRRGPKYRGDGGAKASTDAGPKGLAGRSSWQGDGIGPLIRELCITPAIFCIQNNQTALSTPVKDQSAVRTFAEKAVGYGVPGLTIDGTDPEAIAGAFGWAAERARAGLGPTLIELVAMRLCGHAHHDDMLYVGRDPQTSWDIPPLGDQGYANRELYEYWAARDPIRLYAARLTADGILGPGDLDRFKAEAEAIVEAEARAIIDAPWPEPAQAGVGVFANEKPRVHVEVLDPAIRLTAEHPELAENNDSAISASAAVGRGQVEAAPAFDSKGRTFLDAVMLGVGDALRADPRVFVYGEDVGGNYGNAFLLLRPLLEEFGDRIVNSPIAEGAVLGVCVGAALAGQRPIGESQFNDFVATGFNQLVNNAAKNRYRWGGEVPMVVRMPWGGLRHAGPYHSQNTEAWFYRTPGLKIVVPSTPHDARALMASAVADPDPVLYYEHIALYRDPRIRQLLSDAPPEPIPIGKAALRRDGKDLAIISYGAYVHVGMRVAEKLAKDGIEAAVLDLRSLAPMDRAAILALTQQCSRVMIIHEDTRTGSVGESIAAIIPEEAFAWLHAPLPLHGGPDAPLADSPPPVTRFLPT